MCGWQHQRPYEFDAQLRVPFWVLAWDNQPVRRRAVALDLLRVHARAELAVSAGVHAETFRVGLYGGGSLMVAAACHCVVSRWVLFHSHLSA